MCGRFALTIGDFAELARLLGVEPEPSLSERFRPRFNVPPSDQHWIVTADADARTILPARWGFGVKKLPLARGETVATQNLFRGAFTARRCVVPTSGFFEWEGQKGARRAHFFHPAEPNALVLLGGIYGEGPDGFDFAVVTTVANETVRPVHDRMPVIVPLGEIDRWLRAEPTDAAALLEPAPRELLVDTPVGGRVNDARNDDETCLAAAPEEQRKLF